VLTGTPALSTTALTSSPTGLYPITVTAGTLAAANYTFTFVPGTLTVTGQTVPTITWATPAAITYGTALSATQLNATASVPGTFAYTPALGSVPAAGTQSLSVTFTPTDNVTYSTATATVNLVVNKATLTVTANSLNKSVNSANPTLSYAVTGFVNGDTAAVLTGAPALSTTALTNSPAGSYPITATAGALTAANYSFTFVNGTMTVTDQQPIKKPQFIRYIGYFPPLFVDGTTKVSAMATSRLPVTFTSMTPSVCTVEGTTVTGVAAGTCTIAADQAGDANYNAAPQVTQNIIVRPAVKKKQFIWNMRFTPQKLSVDGTTTASAIATSRLPVTFSSMTPTVCTVEGTIVTGVAAGTCTIAADQPGDVNYNAAPQVKQNISVGKTHHDNHDHRHEEHMFRHKSDRDLLSYLAESSQEQH